MDAETIPEDIDREATRIAGEYMGSPISCSHLYKLVSGALLAERLASTERAAKIAEELDTLFEDSDGTIPATVGGPVGMVKDNPVGRRIAAAIRSQP